MHDSRTWRQRTGVKTLSHPPTLLMACISMTSSHYLNQCWLIIIEALCHSLDIAISQEMLKISIFVMSLKIDNSILQLHHSGANELNNSLSAHQVETFEEVRQLQWYDICV